MREVSIKALRKSLSSELGNLPFIITKRGVPIAKCTPYGECTPDIGSKCTLQKDLFFNPQPKGKK